MVRKVIIAALAAGLILPGDAGAIPAFARKYRVSCNLCHAPPPRLNDFGQTFAANGFAMSRGEEPRDTIDTGDAMLRLLQNVQFAIRFDMYGTAAMPARESEPSVDLKTPWNIKLLSGGEIAKNISYYMYFFLGERGAVAGLEDAYIQFTDVAKSGVSLIAGQFQVSDPLFKRELRLEYEDYQPYRFRVGDAAPNLTYDRGLMALASPWSGGDIVVMAVNGSGINEADDRRMYDSDNLKNFAGRFSQEVGFMRLGAFGYIGRQRDAAEDITDRITTWGPDATLTLGPTLELNAQYLVRDDSNPFFTIDGTETTVNSAFGELIWSPQGATGRWHAVGLYNWIDADADIVELGLPQGPVSRYQSASAGLHYLLQRNIRLSGEVVYDVERERTQAVIGAFLAW